MPKRRKPLRKRKEALDRGRKKTRRGRPGISHSETVGRSRNYRNMLWTHRIDRKTKAWVRDKPEEWTVQLLKARNEEEVANALNSAPPYAQGQLRPLIPLIVEVVKDSHFPKKPETQADFLADSLAAYGAVSPRRSRDICEEERAKKREKSPHYIIRKEYYVECTCGYKGPARDNACRKCGAVIGLSLAELMGPRLF